jgi:DNA-binding SARP family transcriptional activator
VTRSHSLPIQLQLLGPVRISRADGLATGPLLTQPRRLAIVVYLALARPRGLQARDTLVALLWPEADQSRGRHALRNALHAIRQALGDELIETAGDDFVGVRHDRIECDALAFEEEVAARRFEQALARYDGELLQGFHVSDTPGFERWLDGQRTRLHEMAVTAAWALAEERRASGDVRAALPAARRAHDLAADDELSLRRLLGFLIAAGERGAALRAYREFAERLTAEYGVEPSRETRALLPGVVAAEITAAPPRAASLVADGSRAPSLDAIAIEAVPEEPPVPGRLPTPAAPPEPPAPARARLSRRVHLLTGTAGMALLALLPFLRSSRAEPRPSQDAVESAARREAMTLGAGLAEVYRADTAFFQRYLRAEALLQRDRIRPALDSFQAIVDEAPLYAPAWAGLSTAISLSGFNEIPPRDAMARSLAAAQRALTLDSTLVHAKSSLIAYDMNARWDLEAAKRGLDAALDDHPNDTQLNELLATWHRWRGELPEALALRRKLYALNPLKPGYAQSVGGLLYHSHRCAEAVEVLRHLVTEFRGVRTARGNLYRSYRCLGRMDDAAGALRMQLRDDGDTALAALLDPPLAPARRDSMMRVAIHAQIVRSLEHRRTAWESSRNVANGYAELHDADSTMIWLDSMYAERSMSLHAVPFDPLFDFLHDDPRFRTFARKLPWHPRLPASLR